MESDELRTAAYLTEAGQSPEITISQKLNLRPFAGGDEAVSDYFKLLAERETEIQAVAKIETPEQRDRFFEAFEQVDNERRRQLKEQFDIDIEPIKPFNGNISTPVKHTAEVVTINGSLLPSFAYLYLRQRPFDPKNSKYSYQYIEFPQDLNPADSPFARYAVYRNDAVRNQITTEHPEFEKQLGELPGEARQALLDYYQWYENQNGTGIVLDAAKQANLITGDVYSGIKQAEEANPESIVAPKGLLGLVGAGSDRDNFSSTYFWGVAKKSGKTAHSTILEPEVAEHFPRQDGYVFEIPNKDRSSKRYIKDELQISANNGLVQDFTNTLTMMWCYTDFMDRPNPKDKPALYKSSKISDDAEYMRRAEKYLSTACQSYLEYCSGVLNYLRYSQFNKDLGYSPQEISADILINRANFSNILRLEAAVENIRAATLLRTPEGHFDFKQIKAAADVANAMLYSKGTQA